MKRTLAIAVLVSLAGCSMPARNAEPPEQAKQPEPPTLAGGMMAPIFPRDWVGHWKGSGATEAGGTLTYHFILELDIHPIARPDGTMPPSPGSDTVFPKPGDRYTCMEDDLYRPRRQDQACRRARIPGRCARSRQGRVRDRRGRGGLNSSPTN